MAIEFRLLGDVEARIDGRPVDIGHARQRCVLVALLVEANRVVPVDRLLDRVWADRLPQRARGTLSGYLTRLRQVLATDDVVLARQSGGYLLTVDPMAVDLHRFHRLVAEARATDDDEAAAAAFTRALGLWRGEAFATLDTPWLNDVRDSLDAERLAAELDSNDLALARGRHGALLGDLSARASAHPLDERLAGQLMLALYREGRQADALRHYDQVRQRLADDLGADPSPPLRRLHQQILTADRILTIAAPADRPARPVPRQLPAPLRSFTGRVRELAGLDAVLPAAAGNPAVGIAAVAGTAGVGKTALAVHWAHRVADRFADGQLYVNLRGFDPGGSGMTPAEAIRGFLDALAVPPQRIPASVDAQAGLYRSLLADRRMLIVLDNARDAEQIRPLLPGAPGCLALVTSRDQLTGLIAGEGAHPLNLDLLTNADAHALLIHRLGADRVAAEPDAVDEIITRCARLPLALTIVAARAATHPTFPLAALAGELAEARGGLDALDGGDPASNARAVFSWSYNTLSHPAARLFRLLGLHPGPDVSTAAAASLAGESEERARPLLAELTRAHLLTEHRPGRYTFHDLLRGYARQLADRHDPDPQRHAATHRVLDHYLHHAHRAARLLHPYRDPITLAPPEPGVVAADIAGYRQALAWFDAERRVLVAAVDHAAGTGLDTHAWQLAWTLWTFLDRQGHWHDLASAGQAALTASRRLADPVAQAATHRLLGAAHLRLGAFAETHTHLRRALDLYREAGDLVGEAHALNNLSVAWERQGRFRDALDEGQRSLDLYRAAGHRRGEAHALNTVGWCHALLGDHRLAVTACQRALALLKELGDRAGEAMTWHSLGYAHLHLHLRDHARAATCYRHALDLYRELGDRYYEADTLGRLGDTHHAAGDLGAARTAWQESTAHPGRTRPPRRRPDPRQAGDRTAGAGVGPAAPH